MSGKSTEWVEYTAPPENTLLEYSTHFIEEDSGITEARNVLEYSIHFIEQKTKYSRRVENILEAFHFSRNVPLYKMISAILEHFHISRSKIIL